MKKASHAKWWCEMKKYSCRCIALARLVTGNVTDAWGKIQPELVWVIYPNSDMANRGHCNRSDDSN